ncbi:hypothetical protein ES319_A04G089400v1 [Gossypium barbadense]|uniref:Uncharacterized protein n=1 Tax=Gossypium barbadense TaxID=3634 RepID=A0A5J5W5K0_GOSBA|nr:hypothetical protein ES319_A04G089400v1 [Gossypium barbadense]
MPLGIIWKRSQVYYCCHHYKSGLRSNTTQSGHTSTASSSVKLKSPNRKHQTGRDPVSTQESVAN